MSFRRRMVLLAAGAVAAAIMIASVVVYVVTGNELRGQIDASLRQKLTPGLPQAVQITTVNVGAAQLAKLMREGRLPPGALPRIGFGGSVAGFGLARGSAVTAVPACAKAVLHSIKTAYSGGSSAAVSRSALGGNPCRSTPLTRQSAWLPSTSSCCPLRRPAARRVRAAVPVQRTGSAL